MAIELEFYQDSVQEITGHRLSPQRLFFYYARFRNLKLSSTLSGNLLHVR